MKNQPKKIKRGTGFAICAAVCFIATLWFAVLGGYLYNAMINYKPLPNQPQEGDITLVFLMFILFAVSTICFVLSLMSFLIYLFKRRKNEKGILSQN